ncbi:unnamed protein product, partial [Ectocarpus sp. 6 AP-2014]
MGLCLLSCAGRASVHDCGRFNVVRENYASAGGNSKRRKQKPKTGVPRAPSETLFRPLPMKRGFGGPRFLNTAPPLKRLLLRS